MNAIAAAQHYERQFTDRATREQRRQRATRQLRQSTLAARRDLAAARIARRAAS